MGAYGAYTLFEKRSLPGGELALLPVAHAAGKKFLPSQASVGTPHHFVHVRHFIL